MATNYVSAGERLTLPVTAGKTSGDFDMVGNLPVVLLTDRDSSGNAECAIVGVFKHNVVGADGSGNTAIAIGDKVYLDSTVLNADDANGTEYGIALDAVASGATTEISVRLKGC